MAILESHGREVHSVFLLLGDKENDITLSISWVLAKCPEFLKDIVQHIWKQTPDPNPVVIMNQKYDSDTGITDIEVTDQKNSHIIFEAKRGWNLPGAAQLTKYADRLATSPAAFKQILSLSECTPTYAALYLPFTTAPTGGELVTSFILQKDITLYAHWTKNETGIKGSNLYLEGSETYSCYIAPEDVDSNINISQIEWVVQGNSDIVSISGKGYDSRTGCTDIGFRALKKGQVIIIAKYNGQILRRWTVNVTSDWSNYVGYVNWRKDVESQIWNSNMSTVQKLDAAKDYIKTTFKETVRKSL